MSTGHYHVLFRDEEEDPENWPFINGSIDTVATAIRISRHPIESVGRVCTWGCGQLHELTPDEMKTLGIKFSKDGWIRTS